jgi:DNA-binding response OmpR family regulator
MTILVIDDDAALLRVICLMLRKSGHRVLATTDPITALEEIQHNVIDLLITDIGMPDVTGPELVAASRQLKPGLPVLFISGSDHGDDVPFLRKPFDTDELLAAVQAAVGCTVSISFRRA